MSTNEHRTHSKWEKFLGEDEKWRQWSTYTKAVGRKSGWWMMFETEHTIDYTLTGVDDKPLQQKNDDASFYLTSTCKGLAFPYVEWNDDASFYLTSTCKGLAFPYVECAGGNAFLAWKYLKERYHEVNEVDLVERNEKFATCKLEDLKGDAKIWFIDLEWWSAKIAAAGGQKSPTLR
jgi:hypothetical protein